MKLKAFTSIEKHRVETYDNAQENNLTLEEFSDDFLVVNQRDTLREEYSYAIPNQEAIETICSYSPIWEIGSGTGYWAKLISEQGGQIVATEISGNNSFFPDSNIGKHYPVKLLPRQKPKDLKIPAIFSLFICWPPYDNPMAFQYLESYRGSTFIYVGEGAGGCTATEPFFELLDDKWQSIRTVVIPQFPAIHDYLVIYKRK